MTAPLSNRPKITQSDLGNGFVTRYFVRNVSTGAITEIDATQFGTFKSSPLYQSLQFPWIITGNAYDTVATDGSPVYGTMHKNLVTILFYDKKLPGLLRIVGDPLKYFNGVYNQITDNVQNTAPPVSNFTVTTTTASAATPEPEWTNVALDEFTDTDGVAITSHTPNLLWTGWIQPSSGPNFTIQSNRLSQGSAPVGGRGWSQTTGTVANDAFKVFVDMYLGTAWSTGGPGIGFRESLSSTGNPTRTTHEGFRVSLNLSGTSGAGRTCTVTLLRYVAGAATTLYTSSTLAIADFDTLGRRLVVTVNADVVDIEIQPANGGTAEHSLQTTITGELYNTTAYQRFGLWSAIGGTPRIVYDNFTVQTLQ